MRGFTKNFAVFLIDMQPMFVKTLALGVEQKIVSKQKKIIRLCAEKDIPLIVFEFQGAFGDYGETIESLQQEIKKVPRVVKIKKHSPNGFTNTSLSKILRFFGIKKIILMGIYAGACVRQTAMSAVNEGYGILTSESLISSGGGRKKNNHDWYRQNGLFYQETKDIIEIMSY